MESIKKLIDSYENWVASNPDTISDVETTTKWASYFIAGRISDSIVVSEMVYSLSNILVLYNDRILDKAKSIGLGKDDQNNNSMTNKCYRLKILLTSLEYCEVFLEISAKRLFGDKGKWFIITMIQICKAIGRFFILKNSTDRIITSPAMPSVNRREIIELHKNDYISQPIIEDVPIVNDTPNFTFRLKRSGRIVRKVEGAPPMQYRDFNLQAEINESLSAPIPQGLFNAEYLYIAKPLIHLTAMSLFGEKCWKQYFIALAVDFISIKLYHKNRHLMNKNQKRELSRRCLSLLMYLMRSPFYERYTKRRLERPLNFIADNIPIAKLLAGPLREYIPHWQNTYFYLWST